MSENQSNIYQELAVEHINISNELKQYNQDTDVNSERLNKLLLLLNQYNEKRKDIQKEIGSKKTLFPAKIHYIFGAFYKCLRYLVLEILATKGKLIDKDNKKSEIKNLLKNIANITKLTSIIDKEISKNQSDSTSEVQAIKLEMATQTIKEIDIFSDNDYKEILKTFEGLESIGDQEWLYNDENYKKAKDEMLRIQKLTMEKTKQELKEKHNYDDIRLEKDEFELKAELYSLFSDKIPFDVHIFVLQNLKDRIIIPWLKRYTIRVEDEDEDNIYRAWVTTPFIDIDVMKYLYSIYFGQETDGKWDDTKYKTLKWTSIESEEQNKEWAEIGNIDKKELENLFFLESSEFDELEDEEKNLIWLAINMVLRQYWRIPRYHKGKIWALQPKCITKEIKGKIVELTLKYLEELLDVDNENHEKRKYHMAKIMGFIENNKDDDENDNLNETSVEYLKNQYDELIKDINENITSDDDEKFKIYMNLFNNKKDEEENVELKDEKEEKNENPIKLNIKEKEKEKEDEDEDENEEDILVKEMGKKEKNTIIDTKEEKPKSDDEESEDEESEDEESEDEEKPVEEKPVEVKPVEVKPVEAKPKKKKKKRKKRTEKKKKSSKNKTEKKGKKKGKKKKKNLKLKLNKKKKGDDDNKNEEENKDIKIIKENNASKEEETTKLSGGGKTKKKKRRKKKTRRRRKKKTKRRRKKTHKKKRKRKRKTRRRRKKRN